MLVHLVTPVKALLTTLSMAVVLCSLPACKSTYASTCEASIACEGGNDADIDACIEQARGAEEVAAAYDCSDPFEAYADCAKERSVCKEGKFKTDDSCEAQEEAVEACVKAGSARGK